MIRLALLGAAGCLVVLVAGCAGRAGGAHSVPARMIHADSQCGVEQPGMRLITDASQWDALRRRLPRRQLGGSLSEPAMPDFSRENVLTIDMGRRPSLGYSLDLAAKEARVAGPHLEIRVLWVEPDPGTVQGQAITSPCMLVGVPAAIGYSEAVVLDTSGRERLRARLK